MGDETAGRLDAPEFERAAREYDAAVTMLQDTGQTVWLLNGAYLLAATVLLGALASLLAQTDTPRWLFKAGGVVGVVLCLLWWGSFEHAYSFYNFRMDFARSLEAQLGYRVLTEGKVLADGGDVIVRDRTHRIHFFGRLWAMQWWTRALIALFGILSLLMASCLP